MNNKINVLLIEDDKSICSFITTALEENGYRITSVHTGKDGLALAASNRPDIILLDLGLPDINGTDVLKSIRTWSHVPIIVISARTTEADKVLSLDLGADDYITKPFGPAELMARIRTGIRHSYNASPERKYKAKDLEIDFEKRLVLLKGEQIHLTQMEYQLLTLLAENSGKVLTYSFLINAIWGPFMDSNNQILRVNMANIRRKIEANPANPFYIYTEVGIGYRIKENELVSN